jgi:hypothetical protein
MLYNDFEGEDAFKQLWEKFKKADAKFIVCDLFDEEQFINLLNLTDSKNPFVYYSNIFSTDFTSTTFNFSDLNTKYSKFLNIIKTTYPTACTLGCDPLGNWVHTLGGKE